MVYVREYQRVPKWSVIDGFWRDFTNVLIKDDPVFPTNRTEEFCSDDNAFHTIIDVPGVKQEDIKVTLKEGVLIITAKGHKEYSMHLPKNTDSDSITVSLDLGRLTITIPKKKVEQRVIPIITS